MNALDLRLRDVSARARCGLKGPAAEAFLVAQGLPLPASPNGWARAADGRLVARLATSEFLVEATGTEQQPTALLAAALLDPAARQSGLVAVPREDFVLELVGARANELLLQVCNVNFAPLARAAGADAGGVVLTSMVGVGVTVVPRRVGGDVVYTIWIDPSYGHYLGATLAEISRELGGGVPAGAGGHGAEAP
jgi:sarcosine oxidase subunit gamma